jgi:hypothetical protein
MPPLASRCLPASAYFEADRDFSSTNSELSIGSLDDIYGTAAESWPTPAVAV